jgi:hypothetical protein
MSRLAYAPLTECKVPMSKSAKSALFQRNSASVPQFSSSTSVANSSSVLQIRQVVLCRQDNQQVRIPVLQIRILRTQLYVSVLRILRTQLYAIVPHILRTKLYAMIVLHILRTQLYALVLHILRTQLYASVLCISSTF